MAEADLLEASDTKSDREMSDPGAESPARPRVRYRIRPQLRRARRQADSWAPAWRRPLLSVAPRRRALLLIGCLIAVCVVSVWLQRAELEARSLMPVAPALAYEQAAGLSPRADALVTENVQVPKPFTVRRGQAPSQLLAELGVTPQEVHQASLALSDHVDLRKLRAGETGLAYYAEDGSLSALRLRLAQKGWVELDRAGNPSGTLDAAWRSSWREFARTTELRSVEGTLDSFLIADVEAAGAPSQLAWSMSEVLQWDLDFNRDLRQGDTFRVLYEEEKLDGHFHRISRVLALVYVNRGVEHEAFLWSDGDADGYYDRDGRPLQKMFLRSPLPFTRVTSRFTHRRFHPVLKTYRPHYGVDFGAPTGTPARVTASGTVTFAGRNGGAGKMVRVRHTNGYETSYLHLSGYGPGVRSGKRLRQGDVVGYVGSTGLSTAPHLDYRVKRNGKYMDPMKLENRRAEPIPQARLAAFQQHRELLARALDGDLDPRALSDPAGEMQLAATGSESDTGMHAPAGMTPTAR